MKILFFIDSLTAGGRERRLSELLKGIRNVEGIDFQLVVMNKDIHYVDILNMGIPVHYIIRKTKKDMSVFGKFYRICKDYKPDIVHCWDSMTAVYSTLICSLLHIKLVNGMVADSPEQQNLGNPHWLRARLTFPFSSKVIGNSKSGLTAYRAPARKGIFIPNGFNFERSEKIQGKDQVRKELDIEQPLVVGMIATYSEYKDYPTYFRAAQAVLDKRKDVIFLAIGKDTDSDNCRNLVEEKYRDHFRFLGKRTGVESIINIIDVGVLATFTEGISNAILEFMAMGKPVVATIGGGTGEIIENESTGFLVDTGDSCALAARIEKLLEDPDLRASMGNAGLHRVKHHFSIESMVANYLSAYHSLLKLPYRAKLIG